MEIWFPAEDRLKEIPGITFAEDWSPDATRLVTNGEVEGKLLIIDLDGEIVQEIDGADDSKANWQRLAIQ
jgi:hypothetical protein